MSIYLFHHQKVEQFFADKYERLSIEIEKIDIANIEDINQRANQIADKYKIAVPTINKGGITSVLNLEDLNGHVYQENPYASYPKPDIVATATVTVPITGNEDCFGLIPQVYSQNTIPALVSKGSLKFKIRTSYVRLDLTDTWKDFIRNKSVEAVEFIETNLKNLAIDFDKFNTRLLSDIVQALEERQNDWNKRNEINKEINPFK